MIRSLLLAVTVSVVMLPSLSRAQQAEFVAGDIMVMMMPGTMPDKIVEDLRVVDGVVTGLKVSRELSAPLRTWLLQFRADGLPQPLMLRAVAAHNDVMMAQNNHIVEERIVPDDLQYGQQWHHQNIASETAWDISTGGVTATGDTIVVCIIERADLPHPDLIDNAWYNHAEIPGNGIDDDGNGYIDDHLGWNTPFLNDQVYGGSHGTQVAGMIGAKGNNGEGVAGANWDVKMMVVNYGGTQEAQVVAAYTYPLVMRRLYNASNGTEGAFVVATNASWGINNGQPHDSPIWCAMYDSLGTAGVLSCGATSNSNVDIDVVGDLPTACPSEYMVSVTATNIDDIRTFSAYGLEHVDVGAPGEDVRTTSIGGGYGSTSGTSFASPLTSGVIGLLYSAPCNAMMELVHADPAAGAIYVRDALFNGVDQVDNLMGQTMTGGRINASNSMALIVGECGGCPAPFALGVEATDSAVVELSWAAVNGEDFDLRYRPVGTPVWTEVLDLDTSVITLDGLIPCAVYEFQVSTTCDGEASAVSNSFTWTTDGCCEMPAGLIGSDFTSSSATITWDDVQAAAEYEFRYREAGTSTWTVLTGLTGNSIEIIGLDRCTSYEAQGRSTCSDLQSEWSELIFFNVYCASWSEDSDDEHIANVQINTLDHTSGNDGGYGDHVDMGTTLGIGETYTISLTPGYGSFWSYQEHFRVYMDLDQNGDLDGPDELVFDAPQTTTTTITGTITIPVSAIPGDSRMRVVMRYDEPADGPCVEGYDYGETEDYCITLMIPTAVQELVTTSAIIAYPDPADRDIFFDVTGEHANQLLTISVLDNTGREVARKRMENGRATITTAFLANGMYVYRVLNKADEIGRGKFIVSHL